MVAPKLRFKEFSGDWEKTTLGEVVKFSNGRRIPLSESDRQKRQGTYRYYGASGVIDYIDDYIFDGQYILIGEDGANILTRSSTLAFVVEGKFWVNNHAHIFQSKNGDNTFLATYLESLNYEKYNSGTAQPKLNLENLKKVIVANPLKEEQTKIASFLSAVDEKINQLTQKHELLSYYKQGMMQKLFSQQIRFKADDGSEFGEWEETTLGEIGTFKSGQGFPEQFQGGKDGIPFFKVSDMNILGNEKIMKVANNYVNSEAITKMKAKVIDNEAIIFAKVGAAIFLERKRLAKNFLIDNNMMAYLSNQKTNIMFLKQFLDNIKLSKFVQVGALPSYNSSDLAIIPISLPCLEEQTKIANFLSAIDQKLEVVAQQIEQAKTWKKGLLQQMFV
ncbi:restriction endonuclease subunit S [Acinetobacter baumannii]|nr:restriction endonuclease subunit S [Acinetobacter baumannii]